MKNLFVITGVLSPLSHNPKDESGNLGGHLAKYECPWPPHEYTLMFITVGQRNK